MNLKRLKCSLSFVERFVSKSLNLEGGRILWFLIIRDDNEIFVSSATVLAILNPFLVLSGLADKSDALGVSL